MHTKQLRNSISEKMAKTTCQVASIMGKFTKETQSLREKCTIMNKSHGIVVLQREIFRM